MSTEPAPRATLPAERRARLLATLRRDGVLRVADLTTELDVTAVTVRRDIAQLEREGLLRRVHGGAVPLETPGGAPGSAPVTTPPARPGDERPGATGQVGEQPVTTSTTGTVGVMVPSLDYYWPGVVRGMEDEARRHGLRVVLRGSSYEAADERPALERLAQTENLRGLILAPRVDAGHGSQVARWLVDSGIPHVLVEREATLAPHREALESVVSDHALGALMAVHHLADLGHRRVGLVLSRESPTSRKVAAGWRAACADLGLTTDEHFERLAPDRHSPEFPGVVDEIVATAVGSGTTALLVHSDPEASIVAQRAMERGLAVPGGLSIISYDDEVAGLFSPAMTAVRPPRDAVGRAAVDLLAKRLADPDRPVHRTAISPQLMVRESTGPVPDGRETH
ncbi:substrate-binding domain-containing protein [Isoptericola sp. S6320L]|uniref:substrate-binding domain-containing protein n=1 Tax=Isoptericola sp. S6320L TaxID=2926411 RepID=UPI001FF37EF4|nr:substrate-binding domain-containing protein [Isoptericola sp. S6320L]MCK0117781.1 substrate-binding domain-containing protein [Isoptericola sp. S6320L]